MSSSAKVAAANLKSSEMFSALCSALWLSIDSIFDEIA